MSSAHLKEVIKYYEETDWDHRNVWHKGIYQAAHFGIYDDKANRHIDALMNTTRIMAHLSNVKNGSKVLDAGCGWGGTSLWLANHLQADVVGINITPYQIDECTRKAEKIGVTSHCKFIASDYCHTPFSDATFDVVWSCESLCHAPEKQLLYREAARILKPGGRLVIADYLRNLRPVVEEDRLHRWLDGWACKDIDTAEEHHQHACDAGFGTFERHDYSDQVNVSLRNLYVHAKRWRWIGVMGDSLGLLKPYRLKNVEGTIAMYETFLKQMWTYNLIVCSI